MKDGNTATNRQLEIIIKMLNTPGARYLHDWTLAHIVMIVMIFVSIANKTGWSQCIPEISSLGVSVEYKICPIW